MKNTGIILLAAGCSSRLGSPKQLLLFEGKTLLEKIIDTSLNVFEKENIILVLGSEHEKIESSIQDKNISICINTNWKSGMASSINLGVKTLLSKFPEMQKCFISVCDQPYLNNEIFVDMMKIFENSAKEIVVAKYAETLGVPALFSKKYFEELTQLEGEQGAKKIILQNSDDVAIFEFEKGAIDIDTPSDYDNLKFNK